ncbi:MAG TPA: FAD:protein FMN transferase [Desulfomonilaceae bacterium]|nr:FAD:protein FMN transferase [Desulfomonilaceae bacterium]
MESQILTLDDQVVMVECGPMRMFIDGSFHGTRRPETCRQAAESAIKFLEEIAYHRDSVRAPANSLSAPPEGLLVHTMWAAVSMIGDGDLTPMAAVAGTIADATADFLSNSGLTRVVVNNGGDVALRMEEEEKVSVGIRPDVNRPRISHRIILTPEMAVGGVCTSGLGGRSFTRGIASAATVFAHRSDIADAAATAVANATYVKSPAVHRRLADAVDPDTDLKGVEVTTRVGALACSEIELALEQGIARAEELVKRGLIKGACVTVKSRMRCTESISALLEPFNAEA